MEKNGTSLIVKCPHCNHSLLDYNIPIRGKPSIKLFVKSGNNTGILNLCSIYGCYRKLCDIDLADGDIVELMCPECKNSLKSKSLCDICGAPLFVLKIESGGKLQNCSRVNCKKHRVVFEDIYDELMRYFTVYEDNI
jgi:hypothetical protein